MRETKVWIGTHRAAGYVLALGLTAIVTGAIAAIEQIADVANISMLYLVAVMASAIAFGSGPAILSSITAFLAFDLFFTAPRYTATVSDPEEWVALGLLLVTGIITGQLAAALRGRARAAQRREREAAVLYDVVQLMNDPDLNSALAVVAERLRRELELAALLIHFGEGAPVAATAAAGQTEALDLARRFTSTPSFILGPGAAPTADQRAAPGRWIRVISPQVRSLRYLPGQERLRKVAVNLQGRQIGSILLVQRPGFPPLGSSDDRLLSAVANQLGLTMERLRLRAEAVEAEILRRTDELKTALLNAVSHDLRTPLSSIIASAGSLLQEDVNWTEEERRDFAHAIEEEAQRLNRLVGNLLNLSRIEAGSLRPDKGWYDLSALVDDVLGRLRSVTSKHQVIMAVQDELPPVFLDYIEIDEVLTNLIENAVKHTPPGSEIAIRATRENDVVRVEVVDRGPGIPPEALPRLFEPFYRVQREGQMARGTGLGLAVAKGLVEAHGGHMRAENRKEGGASFVFTLPLGEFGQAPVEAAGESE